MTPPLHCITLAFRLNKRIKHGFLVSCAKRYHFLPFSGVSFFGEREVIFSRWTLLQAKVLLIIIWPSILTSHYIEAKESLSPLFNLIAIAVTSISWLIINLGIPNILELCHLEMRGGRGAQGGHSFPPHVLLSPSASGLPPFVVLLRLQVK